MAGSGTGWFRWVALALLVAATGLLACLVYASGSGLWPALALVVLVTTGFGLGWSLR